MSGNQRQQVRSGCAWAIGSILLSLALPGAVRGADVFVSTSPDGSQRYATQALDRTYRLIHREAAQLPATDPPTSAPRRDEALRAIIERAALRHGVSPALIEAVVQVESNRDANAVSPKGARGAMQLMPATAERYGLSGPHSWRDPERNIDAGVRHLKDLLARHRGNVVLALAAYNAGAGAVGRHRNRIPPYRETMLYVPAVLARSASVSAP